MKTIKDIPQSERTREKLLEQGASFLSDRNWGRNWKLEKLGSGHGKQLI